MTTLPCPHCSAAVPVNDYIPTGESRKDTWWSGRGIQIQCPRCGRTFWAKQ